MARHGGMPRSGGIANSNRSSIMYDALPRPRSMLGRLCRSFAAAVLAPRSIESCCSASSCSSAARNSNTWDARLACPIQPMRQAFPWNCPKPAPISIPNRLRRLVRTTASSTSTGMPPSAVRAWTNNMAPASRTISEIEFNEERALRCECSLACYVIVGWRRLTYELANLLELVRTGFLTPLE